MSTWLVLAAISVLPAQNGGKPDPDVDPIRVDAAIKKGVDYLRTRLGKLEFPGPGQAPNGMAQHLKKTSCVELVLLTFVHAGVPESDEDFQKLFRTMMEGELAATYNVSLQAMVLEKVDRVRHQGRIFPCAQFLVDNQARNGQWSYGAPTKVDVATSGSGRGEVATSGSKPRAARRVAVQKRRDGPETGDNSNSQYAALGLRACHDAGILLPESVLKLAEKSWRSHQKQGNSREGRGWAYGPKEDGQAAYGSMTAGAVSSLIIYDHILKQAWKQDRDVQEGARWLASNFTVSKNPGAPPPVESGFVYYYLYGLERACILSELEALGKHRWYAEGARFLLADQNASDGSWGGSAEITGPASSVWDTCFAILFLRRATRPLKDVASVDPAAKAPQEAAGTLEKVATGFKMAEGPAWDGESLHFTDVPPSKVIKLGADGKPSTVRSDTRWGAGLAFDSKGRLILCEVMGRRVTRVEKDGAEKTLAETYDGKKLNGPNDLAVDAKDGIYFTDPLFMNRDKREQDKEAVYYIAPGGKLLRVAEDMERPNGIALAHDGKTLFVADTAKSKVRAYSVNEDGTLGDGRDFGSVPGPDGVKADSDGNVYAAGRTGVAVWDAAGKRLGTLKVPEPPTSLVFGGADRRTMYVTTPPSVYKIRLDRALKTLSPDDAAAPKKPETPQDLAQRIQGKAHRLQEGVQKWVEGGKDPSPVAKIMEEFGPLIEAGKPEEAEAILDKALKLVEGSEK